MHTYRKTKDEPLWTVGYYTQEVGRMGEPISAWMPMKDFNTEEEAACYVNYLNGGVLNQPN
jgi:hypothetical protein